MQSIYRPSLATLTDLYQLTMGAAYHATGREKDEAVFHLFFRRPPFGSGFTLAAGLAVVVEYLTQFRFSPEDLGYLAGLRGVDSAPLFTTDYLQTLAALEPGLGLDIDAVPEGTVVFPYEPLLRVQGSLLAAQIVETALLNMINFPTLVATNAARVVLAAGGAPVLEFGLRRAQDGLQTPSTYTTTPKTPTDFTIGSQNGLRFFNGLIDDVRIYNRALSSNEVSQLHSIEAGYLTIHKAVYLDSGMLSLGTNYQLQVSSDLLNWTNQGAPFTATDSYWRPTNYWDVENWGTLFFRLKPQ